MINPGISSDGSAKLITVDHSYSSRMTELNANLVAYFTDQDQKVWAMGVSSTVSYVIQQPTTSPDDACLRLETD